MWLVTFCFEDRDDALTRMVGMANRDTHSATTDGPAPGATPTPASTDTPAPPPTTGLPPTPADPRLRYAELKRHFLGVINARRSSRSLPPLELNADAQVQLHTEQSLEDCTFGSWTTDGLSIHMKYSLAGIYQPYQILGYGLNYCLIQSDGAQGVGDSTDLLTNLANLYMEETRLNPFLTPWNNHIDIGIAYDDLNLRMYTLLSGDHVSFDELPKIDNGELAVIGVTKGQVRFARPDQLTVQMLYEPPPEPLTAGQLARSSCLYGGHLIVSLTPTHRIGTYQSTEPLAIKHDRCKPPHEISANSPTPQTESEAKQLISEARASQEQVTNMVPQLKASKWIASGKRFEVRADISSLLEQHGPGLYTVLVFYYADGIELPIVEYSMFHGITPPDTYMPKP